MSSYSVADVKKLRELTDAPMMACKKALEDADGDLDKAADLVRERTGAKMQARAADRSASEGIVYSYLHTPTPGSPPRVGVLLQLNCETDFVGKNEKFQELARQLAMHIAAARPIVVSENDVDAATVEKEKEFARKAAIEEGKPENIVEKVVEGKVRKFYEESVLLNQKFVMDDSKTIAQVIQDVQGVLGEKVEVGRFVRFEVGA